jgi:hypothetical protein
MDYCRKPLVMGFNKAKRDWFFFVKDYDIKRFSPDKVCQVNFQIAVNNGQVDFFIESFLAVFIQLTLEQQKNFVLTVSSILHHQIILGELESVKEIADLVPKDSTHRTRALVNLGIRSSAYVNEANESVDMALESDDEVLQIIANKYLLGVSMSDFSIKESEKRIVILDNLYENRVIDELPVNHVIKKQYLAEMKQSQGFDKITGEDIHEAFLSPVIINKNHRQKVVLSAFYLQKVFNGISADHEIYLGCSARNKVAIPKVIVQHWDKSLIPDDVSACMGSIKPSFAGYDHLVFNRESATDFISDPLWGKLYKPIS